MPALALLQALYRSLDHCRLTQFTDWLRHRLVEALESYEPANERLDPMMDTYASESVRSQLLGGGKQHRRVRPSMPIHGH